MGYSQDPRLLLKLGIAVAQSTVSIYMVLRQGRSFLRNHTEEIASIDLFVVPTIAFRQLFVCLVLGHRRRQLLLFAVTQNPTAEWLARQITEAFPWDFQRDENRAKVTTDGTQRFGSISYNLRV